MVFDQLTHASYARRLFVRVQGVNGDEGKKTPEQGELASAHFRIQQIRGIGVGYQAKHALTRCGGFNPRRALLGRSLSEKKDGAEWERPGSKSQSVLQKEYLSLVVVRRKMRERGIPAKYHFRRFGPEGKIGISGKNQE